MKIIDCVQGSDSWLQARLGLPTASELDALVSPTGKIRTGEGPNTYLCRKLAERWLGRPLDAFTSHAMEQGSILEEEALPYYELESGHDLTRPGFLTTDDGSFGCSPDALAGAFGVEIKCPEPTNHVKWLMAGECPPDHLLQCQGGMYLTGFSEWHFVSYHRAFPKLVVVVKRDDELMDKISDALSAFSDKMHTAWNELCECNGGPPRRTSWPHKPKTPDIEPMIGLETDADVKIKQPDFEVKV